MYHSIYCTNITGVTQNICYPFVSNLYNKMLSVFVSAVGGLVMWPFREHNK